ncbi:MAG: ABC-2 transporter permease [Vallitalea sp.]|jgi:hypothetical protein|nr:ABC-2 transporter permease [Vallitalea sp.]
MKALNYFKLDIRIMKKSIKGLLLFPIISIVMFSNNNKSMAFGYLFLFLVIFAVMPFTIASNEKTDRMYYLFPTKISSIVLGRYIFLVCGMAVIWICSSLMMAYYYSHDVISMSLIKNNILIGLITSIICFIQYPIYYKYGVVKGKIVSMLIYMIPGFLVFGLSGLMEEKGYEFAINNNMYYSIIGILITILIAYISYLISCSICRKKEI